MYTWAFAAKTPSPTGYESEENEAEEATAAAAEDEEVADLAEGVLEFGKESGHGCVAKGANYKGREEAEDPFKWSGNRRKGIGKGRRGGGGGLVPGAVGIFMRMIRRTGSELYG